MKRIGALLLCALGASSAEAIPYTEIRTRDVTVTVGGTVLHRPSPRLSGDLEITGRFSEVTLAPGELLEVVLLFDEAIPYGHVRMWEFEFDDREGITVGLFAGSRPFVGGDTYGEVSVQGFMLGAAVAPSDDFSPIFTPTVAADIATRGRHRIFTPLEALPIVIRYDGPRTAGGSIDEVYVRIAGIDDGVSVPEPSTTSLLIAGLGALAVFARRRS